jgi:hypothetical protein
MAADGCEQQYIDVTEHSTADIKPLGNLNRARRSAESASRRRAWQDSRGRTLPRRIRLCLGAQQA